MYANVRKLYQFLKICNAIFAAVNSYEENIFFSKQISVLNFETETRNTGPETVNSLPCLHILLFLKVLVNEFNSFFKVNLMFPAQAVKETYIH